MSDRSITDQTISAPTFGERVESQHAEVEECDRAAVPPISPPNVLHTSMNPSSAATVGSEITKEPTCYRSHGLHPPRSVQLTPTDDRPGPPFTCGNRLGFIQGETIQGPMTRISHGMQVFDMDVMAQVEYEHMQTKHIANTFHATFTQHPAPKSPAQLICLHDPNGRPVSAVEIANFQAETIQEQENEIDELGHALEQAWKDIEMLRIELWRRTSACQCCSQDCYQVSPDESSPQAPGRALIHND